MRLLPFFFIMLPCLAFAERCLDMNLSETIQAADLIAVVEYHSSQKKLDSGPHFNTISLEVKSILKGSASGSNIRVYGDPERYCGNNSLRIDSDGTYMVFLLGKTQPYSTVSKGEHCGVHSLKSNGSTVEIEQQSISIEAFKKQYHL